MIIIKTLFNEDKRVEYSLLFRMNDIIYLSLKIIARGEKTINFLINDILIGNRIIYHGSCKSEGL